MRSCGTNATLEILSAVTNHVILWAPSVGRSGWAMAPERHPAVGRSVELLFHPLSAPCRVNLAGYQVGGPVGRPLIVTTATLRSLCSSQTRCTSAWAKRRRWKRQCCRAAGSRYSRARDRTGEVWVCNRNKSELRSCVKVEVAVLGCPSLTVLVVYANVKQHWTWAWNKSPSGRHKQFHRSTCRFRQQYALLNLSSEGVKL